MSVTNIFRVRWSYQAPMPVPPGQVLPYAVQMTCVSGPFTGDFIAAGSDAASISAVLNSNNFVAPPGSTRVIEQIASSLTPVAYQ